MTGARRWLGYLGIVVLFSIACGLLAWWQFSRLEEARERVDRIERNWDAEPASLGSILPELDAFDESLTWHPVAVTGEYLVDEQLLVRGRPRDGLPGFEVLVPFQAQDGTILIVDRGWIAVGDAQDDPDDVPAAPTGTIDIVVRVKASEPQIPGRTAPAGQVATIHLPTVAELVGGSVHTGAYGLIASEEPALMSVPAPPMKPALDEGPHLSYALQWIVFALMAFAALGWAIRQEVRIRRGELPREPSRTRRPTDTDIEDAQLDEIESVRGS